MKVENSRYKFRAWDKEESDWIEIKSFGFLGGELWYIQAVDDNENEIDPPYFVDSKDVELMQFTGLHDANGKAIYEGDIVHIYDEGPFSTVDMLDVVIFKNGCFTTEKHIYDFYTCGGDCLTVRGNIYENPELIGGNQ